MGMCRHRCTAGANCRLERSLLTIVAVAGLVTAVLLPGPARAQEQFDQQIDCYLSRLIEKADGKLEQGRVLTEKNVRIVRVRGRTISYRKRGHKETMYVVAALDMHCQIKVPGS